MRGCPCYKCPDRHEACHDHCERFQDWREPFKEIYLERKINALYWSTPKSIERSMRMRDKRMKNGRKG